MTMLRKIVTAATLSALISATPITPSEAVVRQEATVNGLKVFRFVWTDSRGLTRTVSLKQEGQGNPGHAGYAIQMSYKYIKDGLIHTVSVNAPPGDGFGYFVSHERYRKFSDGDSKTIAHKIFGRDDSPLGRGFAVTARHVETDPNKAITSTYPRYGTIAATNINQDTGEDDPLLLANARCIQGRTHHDRR